MSEVPSVTFVGALNVDTLISINESDSSRVEQILEKYFHRDGEREVDAPHLEEALSALGDCSGVQQLSGSSFIAMHAAHSLRLPLDIRCMGVEGSVGPGLESFSSWLSQRDINKALVFPNLGRPAASCAAVTYQGNRSLATFPGANVDAGRIFLGDYPRILKTLQRCTHVHITSFFDEVTPDVLLRLAKELRSTSGTKLSLDPGLRWITTRERFVREFAANVDTLFLNSAEFVALCDSDRDTAKTFANSAVLERIIVKQLDATWVFARGSAGRVQQTVLPHEQLPDHDILDDTGAGDVFAGALIAVELAHVGSPEQQISLAVRFAKQKLQRLGQDFSDFAELLQSWRAELSQT